jgi:hypothetical protein
MRKICIILGAIISFFLLVSITTAFPFMSTSNRNQNNNVEIKLQGFVGMLLNDYDISGRKGIYYKIINNGEDIFNFQIEYHYVTRSDDESLYGLDVYSLSPGDIHIGHSTWDDYFNLEGFIKFTLALDGVEENDGLYFEKTVYGFCFKGYWFILF